jgi:hypothetical protein
LSGWRDSNPHASRHQILSLARLPITPHPGFEQVYHSKGLQIYILIGYFRRKKVTNSLVK